MSTLNGNGRPLSAFAAGWEAQWVIEDLWQARGVNMLCGAPRARKSTLNAYLIVCALTGSKVFGILPVKPIKRAAVFLGEGIVEAEATRFYAAFRGLEIDSEPYGDRLVLFGPQAGLRFDPGANSSMVRKELEHDGFDLVGFDPLVNFHGQEENTSKMAVVMAQITAFTEFATVSLLHHVTKPLQDGMSRTLSHQARGHSSIAGYTSVNTILERSGGSDDHTLRTDAKYTDKHGSLKVCFVNGIWLVGEMTKRSKIEGLLADNPNISQNEIVKAVGGRREDILSLVKTLKNEAQGGSQTP